MSPSTIDRPRSVAVGLLVILVLMSLVSLSLAMPSQAAEGTTATPNANDNLATAQRSADEARSLYWAASARLLDQNGDRASALALALEANRIPKPPDQSVQALEDIAYAPGPRRLIRNNQYNLNISAAFSPDGKQVIVGDGNGQLALYDLITGEGIRSFCCHQWAIVNVGFSPDGRQFFSEGKAIYGDVGGPNEFNMWDVNSENPLWSSSDMGLGYTDNFDSAVFSPDGKTILTNDGFNHLIERDVKTGAEVRRYSGKAADKLSGNMAYKPHGSQIVSGTLAGEIIVWDAQTSHQIMRFSNPYYPVYRVAFNPDGMEVFAANTNNIVVSWDVKTGEAKHSFYVGAKAGLVTNMFFDHVGASFYTSTAFGDFIQWDIESEESLRTIHTRGTILNMSPDKKSILVQSPSVALELWDVQQGQEARRYKGHRGQVNDLAFSPDTKRFVSAGEHGELILWDTNTQKEIFRFIGHLQNNDVSEVAYSPDGRTIASVGSEGRLFIWDAQTGTLLYQMFASPASIAFSPDGQSLISTEGENLIQRDVSSGRETWHYIDPEAKHEWESAVYNADGRMILSVDTRLNVVLWDVATGNLIRKLSRSRYAVFTPDGQQIVSEDDDHNMIFSDALTGKGISRIDRHKLGHETEYGGDSFPNNVAFSVDGQRFMTSS